MKKKLLTLSKLLIAAAFLWLVFQHIDAKAIVHHLKHIEITNIILAVLFATLAQIAGAYRMRFILSEAGVHITPGYSITITYIGSFFNFLLPGGIGGDAIKVYLLRKNSDLRVFHLIKLLLADRGNGLYFLCVMAIALLWVIEPFNKWPWLKYALVAALVVVTLSYFLMAKLLLAQSYRTSYRTIAYSIVMQICWVATLFTLWSAMQHHAHLIEYILLYTLASIAGFLPISIGGLGLREMTFLLGAKFLHDHAGLNVDETVGVAISLALYAVTVLSVLPGILFLKQAKHAKISSTS